MRGNWWSLFISDYYNYETDSFLGCIWPYQRFAWNKADVGEHQNKYLKYECKNRTIPFFENKLVVGQYSYGWNGDCKTKYFNRPIFNTNLFS